MIESFEWVWKRDSLRAYSDVPVSDALVHALLQAAMAAPSRNDVRPWDFVVVQDAHRRDCLSQTHRWSHLCAAAPLVITIVGDPSVSNHWVEDCSAATENLLVVAKTMGLRVDWVAVYPTVEREAHIRSILNIPRERRVLCLLSIGYSQESKSSNAHYEENKVHSETFDNYSKVEQPEKL